MELVTDTYRVRSIDHAHSLIERCCRHIGNPVIRGPGERRSIALTFDDGPSPGTLLLLKYLTEAGVRATFFQCGLNVLRHAEVARAVLQAGHEIGNHSYSHARLAPRPGWRPNLRSPRFVVNEFAAAQAVFRAELGMSPVLMRVPYGLHWFGTESAERQLGLRDILWTLIGHDWEWPVRQCAEFLLSGVAPGAILCLHDGRDIRPSPDIETTIRTVRRIVPVLLDLGYRFETVSELLQPDRVR
jgi:peptidoglycan/xylan/chitin deacetylase (PgdA/CDA1 family)